MAEFLGHLIKKQRRNGSWKGIKITKEVEALSHMQFVDDTFLAGEANETEAKVMKQTLELYGKFYGQLISWNKSKIYFFNTALIVR